MPASTVKHLQLCCAFGVQLRLPTTHLYKDRAGNLLGWARAGLPPDKQVCAPSAATADIVAAATTIATTASWPARTILPAAALLPPARRARDAAPRLRLRRRAHRAARTGRGGLLA